MAEGATGIAQPKGNSARGALLYPHLSVELIVSWPAKAQHDQAPYVAFCAGAAHHVPFKGGLEGGRPRNDPALQGAHIGGGPESAHMYGPSSVHP